MEIFFPFVISSHFTLLLPKRQKRGASSEKSGMMFLMKNHKQNASARVGLLCFRSGDFDLKDVPRSERPTEVDDNKINAMIENNRRSTTQKIEEKLNISHICIERHVKQLGYVNKLDIWVPHKYNEMQLTK